MVGRARERAYGRERARRRLASGRWDPHPGWRNRVEQDLAVLTDQVTVLARVDQLVDAELWRADKQDRWTPMLHRLVYSMDWTTGLVCGVTAAQLATAGGCSQRTVSRLLAWAQDVDLLVVVEQGAAAAFLGSDCNRAPAYVFVAPATPPDPVPPEPENSSAQLSNPGDESGDLPHSSICSKPLTNGRRLEHPSQPNAHWPLWQVPTTPAERSAAVTTLLNRTGLGGRQVPAWRARALLHRWWADGACVAGLLWAIDHHPDRPSRARGDALRGATDPLRVLGYRLSAWIGQLHRLPAELTGRHGDYRAQQVAHVAARVAGAEHNRAQRAAEPTASTAAVRAEARATLAAELAEHTRRHGHTAATR